MVNNTKPKNVPITRGTSEKWHLDIFHYKQKYHWDCGLSCILMVLNENQRHHFINNFSEICREEGFNKSTWTIDLCYILKRFNVKHTFYTITFGVNPGHKASTFYSNVLNKDENRVNFRFKSAIKHGIKIKERAVSMDFILNKLKQGPVIVLTNSRLLSCDICKLNKVKTELRKCIPWPQTYQGHYIVLCGYDNFYKKVYYRNPAFSEHKCVMSMQLFEQARKSYGTDEDIIFINNNKIIENETHF